MSYAPAFPATSEATLFKKEPLLFGKIQQKPCDKVTFYKAGCFALAII
jgi:hypothetical protein